MEFPQCPEQEFFSVSRTGFLNGIVDQFQLLLVQTDDNFSEIIFIAGHDSVSAHRWHLSEAIYQTISGSIRGRIHHRDGVDLN